MVSILLFCGAANFSWAGNIVIKGSTTVLPIAQKVAEAYMKESLGILVYQDDLMLTVIHLAGYNWMEADKFRKAVGKKLPEEMAQSILQAFITAKKSCVLRDEVYFFNSPEGEFFDFLKD